MEGEVGKGLRGAHWAMCSLGKVPQHLLAGFLDNQTMRFVVLQLHPQERRLPSIQGCGSMKQPLPRVQGVNSTGTTPAKHTGV